MTLNSPINELRDPAKALTKARILWAALLVGPVIFAVIVLVTVQSQSHHPQKQLLPTMMIVSIAMLVTAVPVGYFIRSQTYKKNWRGDVVTPAGYVSGNLILWALCEGVTFFSLVSVMLTGIVFPPAIVAIISTLVMLINFPTGGPMKQPGNPYEQKQ